MPETAAKGKSHSTPSRDDGRSDSNLPPLRVHYYRQMKPQRVYAVEVSWQRTARPPQGASTQVTVRLILAGAQVLPAEQTLDAAKPDVKAIFYVTPLAKGWLRNQKLEVLAHGRKVQEIPMATKVVSQRGTWILLLLTFLLPWLILEYIKYSPLAGKTQTPEGKTVYRQVSKELQELIRDNVPETPEFLRGVERGLLDARSFVGNGYQHLVQLSGVEPIAFYTGVIFLVLTFLSAYLHKQKRQRTKGKPIPIAALSQSIEAEK